MTVRGTVLPAHQPNSFGFLRLMFATMVIASHSPELIDGNRSREILTRLFGTLSFGELGVHGFFLISGYLITKSYVTSAGMSAYLGKRLLRIYPGYVASFLICWLVVGPLAGGHVPFGDGLAGQIWRLLTLGLPERDGAFAGLHYPSLNGSMWTIAYEFRCYLLVALLGWLGVLRRKVLYGTLTGVLAVLMLIDFDVPVPGVLVGLLGSVRYDMQFFTLFFCGGCFYVFRDHIRLNGRTATVAALLLAGVMFVGPLADLAVGVFGGYLLFWFAFSVTAAPLSRIGGRIDLSYGLYLYAWPVQSLIIQNAGPISPWLLFAIATPLAGVLGYASWRLVEQPFLRLKGHLHRPLAPVRMPEASG